MDTYIDERDYRLLENDRYTFFVMKRVMGTECRLLLSDHEKMIICFTAEPYPIWIWTPDDLSNEDMEKVYLLAKENDLLDGKHRFNVKYELAEYFIERSKTDNLELSIITNMFAYDNLDPIEPLDRADGYLYKCRKEDVKELVEFITLFHGEIGIDQKSREEYRNDAIESIDSGRMFFWKDQNGNSVACCKYVPNEDMASISLVYTRPEHRRRHYAENLVYQVTMIARNEGFVPMLYTDADYIASNACYEKIGYILRGKLCTIG